MNKALKAILIILAIAAALIIVIGFLIGALLGTFNLAHPKEIATYNSPDGAYSLAFEQIGDPEWPFGPTDVRLTLKDRDGKVIERISTQLQDDGANAGEHSIVSVSWNNGAVTVVLRASEMENKEVSIAYNKS